MVYLLVGKFTKLNAEIIEINQESNKKFLNLKRKKDLCVIIYFFFLLFLTTF